ncbi:MAG: hydrogenase, partial [Desulfurivibrionaceae bacterium]
MDNLLQIKNGEKVSRADIPQLLFADFRQALLDIADQDGYIVQFFAYKAEEANRLLAVLRRDGKLYAAGCEVGDSYPSLTAANEKFHMFEREIAEQYGI